VLSQVPKLALAAPGAPAQAETASAQHSARTLLFTGLSAIHSHVSANSSGQHIFFVASPVRAREMHWPPRRAAARPRRLRSCCLEARSRPRTPPPGGHGPGPDNPRGSPACFALAIAAAPETSINARHPALARVAFDCAAAGRALLSKRCYTPGMTLEGGFGERDQLAGSRRAKATAFSAIAVRSSAIRP
jgi:hypothetical protein